MSKAFTREDDGDALPPVPRRSNPLPPGTKNYITPGGARRLRSNLEQLLAERRRIAETNSPDSRIELQKIDQYIVTLQEIFDAIVIVPPPEKPWEQVRFGATVWVRDAAGVESTFRIVGVDETDIDRDWVSWVSPIGCALLNVRLGQRVRFHIPVGEQQLEIVAIDYE
jgi:transcription elongation factor GreB